MPKETPKAYQRAQASHKCVILHGEAWDGTFYKASGLSIVSRRPLLYSLSFIKAEPAPTVFIVVY